MASYLIAYDLRREYNMEAWLRVAESLRDLLDSCTPLYSFWLADSSLSPNQIIDALVESEAISREDGIVILEVSGRGNCRNIAAAEAANWLNTHLTFT